VQDKIEMTISNGITVLSIQVRMCIRW